MSDLELSLLCFAFGVIFKRDSFLFFVLGSAFVLNSVWVTLFSFEGFYLARLVFWFCALSLYIRQADFKIEQAILLVMAMILYSLLAIEDYFYEVGFNVSLIYDNFEACAYAICCAHLCVAFTDYTKSQQISYNDSSNSPRNLEYL